VRRVTVNFLVDIFGFVVFLFLVGTGVIIKYILEPGTGGGLRGGRGGGEVETFLSLRRHEWGTIHFWISVIFVVIVVVHILLHYKWIKAYLQNVWFAGRKKKAGREDQPFFIYHFCFLEADTIRDTGPEFILCVDRVVH
jgi:hypothetical protein